MLATIKSSPLKLRTSHRVTQSEKHFSKRCFLNWKIRKRTRYIPGTYRCGHTWFRRPEQMRPKRLGELHSVCERADRCISCSAETSLECVDGGRINDTLIKAVPSVNNTLKEKVMSHIQTTSAFGYLGWVTSGSAVVHQSKQTVKTIGWPSFIGRKFTND